MSNGGQCLSLRGAARSRGVLGDKPAFPGEARVVVSSPFLSPTSGAGLLQPHGPGGQDPSMHADQEPQPSRGRAARLQG